MKFLIPLLFLTSCFGPRLPEAPIGSDKEQICEGLGCVLQELAYYGTWLGGVIVFMSILYVMWGPDKKRGLQGVVSGISLIVAGQMLMWVGAHMVLLSVITLIGGLAFIAYKYREEIEDAFDGETEALEKKTGE